jgi:phenylacetate-CoA ligase
MCDNVKPDCVMLGPSGDAFGGMASVVAMYQAGGLFDSEKVQFIATFKPGTKYEKLTLACSALFKYFKILLHGGGRVLHVHVAGDASFWRKFFFIWLARVFNRSILFHLHGGDFIRFWEERCPPAFRPLLLYTLRNADYIACLSSPMAAWLKQKVPTAVISILPNPIVIGEPPQDSKVRPPTILFLGAIASNKGIFDLVYAFSRILEVTPTARLVLAGSGDLPGVRALASELGCSDAVETLGWIGHEKKHGLLKQARILALPSHFEGQPMVILEAMAAGALIVASKVGGIPDIVQHQRSGILVEPQDRSELIAALTAGMALSSENDAIVMHAYRYVSSIHDVLKINHNLLELYAQLNLNKKKDMVPHDHSIWRNFFGKIRFWLIDLASGTNTVQLLRKLESIQFESTEFIKHYQEELLVKYVDSVRLHSSLYKSYQELAQFPLIDKAFAIENRDGLMNRDYSKRIFQKKTGGSTGQPFVYITGTKAQSYLWAGILLSWRTAGYRLGEPVAFLAGSSLFGSGYKRRIYYKLMNVQLLSAFNMSNDMLDFYAEEIARKRVRLLYGYASAIHELAMHLLKVPVRPTFMLRGIVCTAETLTSPMRENIELAFGVPCFSQYGCHEAGVSAYECEKKNGFHLITTRCYTEILEGARLISTDMANDAFFLPRYDTGDLAVMSDGPCSCGRGFPLIKDIIGRANDLVRDQAGKTVHSEFFTHMFREDNRISAFQVIFDEKQLRVVVHCRSSGSDWTRYVDKILACLVFDSVTFVENVAFVRMPNAKHRFVTYVANVDLALQQAAENIGGFYSSSDVH